MAERRRVRPTDDPIVRQSDLDAVGPYIQQLEARLSVHERVLSDVISSLEDVISSLEEVEATLFPDGEVEDEPAEFGEDPYVELADQEMGEDDFPEGELDDSQEDDGEDPQEASDEELRAELDAEAQQRHERNALRRAERAAEGVVEDGPRAYIATDDPVVEALAADFVVPGEGKAPGVQVAPPQGPQGEPGWSGNEPG